MLGETLIVDVAKTVIEKLTGAAGDRFSKHKELRQRIENIKRHLKANRYVRTYFPLLGELRTIFIENPTLLEKGDNKRFFSTWLQHPVLELGWTIGSEFWTKAKIIQIYEDLDGLKV